RTVDRIAPGLLRDAVEHEGAAPFRRQEAAPTHGPEVPRDLVLRQPKNRHQLAHAQIRRAEQKVQDSQPGVIGEQPEEGGAGALGRNDNICSFAHAKLWSAAYGSAPTLSTPKS